MSLYARLTIDATPIKEAKSERYLIPRAASLACLLAEDALHNLHPRHCLPAKQPN